MGKFQIYFILFTLFCGLNLLGFNIEARPTVSGGLADNESDVVVSEAQLAEWKQFDGLMVNELTIDGLRRTKLQAILWLIKTNKDVIFESHNLALDLQVLYDTGNLYDLQGRVEPDSQGGVHVTISFKDKWTLFPVLGAQGGGGSSTVGAGIFESNFLGYMVNSSILFWQFNGTTSYDVNVNQEYFAGSDNMWSLDWQDNIEAQTAHLYSGAVAGQFAWRRQQKEVMLGTHVDGPWRLFAYASVYQDSIINNDGNFNINIPYTGLQQRIYPKAIYGKVNWNNYQEEGHEFTIQPTFANLIGPGPQWYALELDYKQVWKSGYKNRDNTALYVSSSHMSATGPNFIYQVGGYYNVRGFADMREIGRDTLFTNLEWRPYLFRHRWELFDLDLMVVQGCLFTDAGSAYGDGSLTGDPLAYNFHLLWSAGAGFRINWVKFAGAIIRFDWAQTISPNEGVGFSFGIGQFF